MLTELDRRVKLFLLNKNNKHPRFIAQNSIQRLIDELDEEIVKLLPHGSGIDCDWRIEHREDTTFCCYNSYHAMDQNGMYCGYVDFMVVFDALSKDFDVEVDKSDIEFIVNDYEDEGGEDSNAPCLDDLDDYIYQSLDASLEYYCVKESIEFIRNSGCYVHLLDN